MLAKEFVEKLSFRDYVKPPDRNYDTFSSGEVLKLNNGEIYLVGDINEVLGICDDCKTFTISDISARANIFDLIR
jgi:hypothetical protein